MKNILIFSALVLLLCIQSCSFVAVQGNGVQALEERVATNFSAIDASGDVELVLTQGETEKVSVQADQNLLTYIITEVKGNTLIVSQKSSINSTQRIRIVIQMVNLSSVTTSGSVTINSTNGFHVPSLTVDGSGSVDGKFEVYADKLEVKSSGSSEFIFKGRAKSSLYDLSGSSEVMALDLESEKCNIEISGSGDASVAVTGSLDVDISGSGTVKYKGNPTLKQDVSGSGNIEKI